MGTNSFTSALVTHFCLLRWHPISLAAHQHEQPAWAIEASSSAKGGASGAGRPVHLWSGGWQTSAAWLAWGQLLLVVCYPPGVGSGAVLLRHARSRLLSAGFLQLRDG
jgi:hypothetical protein